MFSGFASPSLKLRLAVTRHLLRKGSGSPQGQDWIARDGSVSTAARKGCRVPQGATRTSPRGRNAGIRPVRRIAPAALERQNVSRVDHLLFGAPRGARTGTKPMNGGDSPVCWLRTTGDHRHGPSSAEGPFFSRDIPRNAAIRSSSSGRTADSKPADGGSIPSDRDRSASSNGRNARCQRENPGSIPGAGSISFMSGMLKRMGAALLTRRLTVRIRLPMPVFSSIFHIGIAQSERRRASNAETGGSNPSPDASFLVDFSYRDSPVGKAPRFERGDRRFESVSRCMSWKPSGWAPVS